VKRWLFGASVAVLIASLFFIPLESTYQGGCSYNSDTGSSCLFAAQSNPVSVGYAFLWLVLLIVFRPKLRDPETSRIAASWRTHLGWCLDLFILGVGAVGLVVPFMLVLEATHTGIFTWQFERNYSVGIYDFVALGIFLGIASLVIWLQFRHIACHQPSIGQYLFGYRNRYQAESDERVPLIIIALQIIFPPFLRGWSLIFALTSWSKAQNDRLISIRI